MRRRAVNSAELSERVTLSKPVRVSVGGGVSRTAYDDVATVWGRVRSLRAAEVGARGLERALEAYEITVRRPLPDGSEPSADFRVTWNGRAYDVEAVDRTAAHYWVLTASGPVAANATTVAGGAA